MQPQRHRDTEAAEKKECEDHFSLSSTCPLAPDTWNDLRAVELFSPPEDTGDFIQFPLIGRLTDTYTQFAPPPQKTTINYRLRSSCC
jgi:hypothetical protein